ncbi:MAG: single-stranded DNA-binding protein [Nitrospinae bacterium]|nr:single-stranded DNA-binding protein [Nitrospinota bacterium]
MASLNKVILIGNLTRDPELRYTPSGMAVAKFGLAVNDRFKQGEEWKERVNFIDIVVWGKQGENCSEYLSKGRPVCVEGRLSYSTWETEDGQKRSKLEVVAERVVFLGGRGDDSSGAKEGKGPSTGYSNAEAPASLDDDVPF